MRSVDEVLKTVIGDIATPADEKRGDWRDENGLLVCGVCGEQKECFIDILGKPTVVPVMCKCKIEERARQEAARKQQERRDEAKRLMETAVQDNSLRHCRFEDAEMTPQIETCKHYAEYFDEFKEMNLGLIFVGPVGDGKTFAAACIANDLIDRGYSVLITSMPRILHSDRDDYEEVMRRIGKYDLVVIDDFGTERTTGYGMETVQSFLDERYKSGKPTLITTNLSKQDLENPKTTEDERILSRIKEMGRILGFPKEDRRVKKSEDKKKAVDELWKKLKEANGDA